MFPDATQVPSLYNGVRALVSRIVLRKVFRALFVLDKDVGL